jgi:plasmid maintenance system killer protein
MPDHKVPEISKELFQRIKLVRRDMGNLLFHFTRAPKTDSIRINDQWRICFKWSGGDAYDVEITDYH